MFFILRLSLIFYTVHAVPTVKQDNCRVLFQGKMKAEVEFKIANLDVEDFIKEYREKKGYVQLSENLKVKMTYMYQLVSKSLTKDQMKRLKWQAFQGTPEEFLQLRGELFNDKGELRTEYMGMDAYVAFANQHYQGDMNKTYLNVSAVVSDKEKMKRLKWQQFQGTPEEFLQLRGELFNDKGELRTEYMGIDAYVAFANQHYQGDMNKTYLNVSAAVSGKSKITLLEWQQFHGKTKDFSQLRDKLFDDKGNLKEEYMGINGQANFADQHYQGDMSKTFKNVSALLGGAEAMKELDLGWKSFQGSADQYRELKKRFDPKRRSVEELLEELRDRKGQEYVAETIFNKNTLRTYNNFSILREELLGSQEAFKQLNWERK